MQQPAGHVKDNKSTDERESAVTSPVPERKAVQVNRPLNNDIGDVNKSPGRRGSLIETEMGKQRRPTRVTVSKENSDIEGANNVSEMQRENIGYQEEPSALGSLMRQSQSGLNLHQEKM